MNVGVIVASRNRPAQLVKAVKSVINAQIVPSQLVIVTSGDDVSHEIASLKEFFGAITHAHSQRRGQINQKKEAIKLLQPQIDYVLFLDDDVEVEADTMTNLLYFLTTDVKCVGVGAKLNIKKKTFSKTSKTRDYVRRNKFMFAGVPRDYQDLESATEVAWLNGISMWRRVVVDHYDNNFPNMPYAIFEDVYFSQIARRFGKLIFVPKAAVQGQNVPDENLMDIEKLFQLRIYANANVVISFRMSWITFLIFGYAQYLFLSLRVHSSSFQEKLRLAIRVTICFLALATCKVNSKMMESLLGRMLEGRKVLTL